MDKSTTVEGVPALDDLLQEPQVRTTIVARAETYYRVLDCTLDQFIAVVGLKISAATLSRYFIEHDAPAGPGLVRLARAVFREARRDDAALAAALHRATDRRLNQGGLYSDGTVEVMVPKPRRVHKWQRRLQPFAARSTHIVCESWSLPLWALPRSVAYHLLERVARYSARPMGREQIRGLRAMDRMWRGIIFSRTNREKVHILARATYLKRLIQRRWPFCFLDDREIDRIFEYLDEVLEKYGVKLFICRGGYQFTKALSPRWGPAGLCETLSTITSFDASAVEFSGRVDCWFALEQPSPGEPWRAFWKHWFQTRGELLAERQELLRGRLYDPVVVMQTMQGWRQNVDANRKRREEESPAPVPVVALTPSERGRKKAGDFARYLKMGGEYNGSGQPFTTSSMASTVVPSARNGW